MIGSLIMLPIKLVFYGGLLLVSTPLLWLLGRESDRAR